MSAAPDKTLTAEERDLKRTQEYYAQMAAAEKTADPIAAQKLARQQQRLAAVQTQQAAFNAANPDVLADRAAATAGGKKKSTSPWLIGAGVVAALGLGFFGYKKWRK